MLVPRKPGHQALVSCTHHRHHIGQSLIDIALKMGRSSLKCSLCCLHLGARNLDSLRMLRLWGLGQRRRLSRMLFCLLIQCLVIDRVSTCRLKLLFHFRCILYNPYHLQLVQYKHCTLHIFQLLADTIRSYTYRRCISQSLALDTYTPGKYFRSTSRGCLPCEIADLQMWLSMIFQGLQLLLLSVDCLLEKASPSAPEWQHHHHHRQQRGIQSGQTISRSARIGKSHNLDKEQIHRTGNIL